MNAERSKREKTFLLSDLSVFEVSLVRKPANGRSFYMRKSADKDSMMSMNDEKLMALLETPAENEGKLDAVLEKMEMSEDAVRAVRAALRLLDAFKDEIPSDTLAGLADAAGMDLHEEEVDPTKSADADEHKSADEMLKSADLPEDLRPAFEALWKSNEDAASRVSELEQVLKGERDKRLLDTETERISNSYGHVPGLDIDKLATMLIDLRKAAPESATAVEEVLQATETAMVAKDDGAFEEAGTTAPSEPAASTAWGRIQAMAAERVKKGDEDSQAQAIDHILTVNPDLYAAYLAEKN